MTKSWSIEIETARAPKSVRAIDGDALIVGRGAECQVQVPDLRVSRQHLRLERRGDGLWAQDLGSRAGTQLNGRPLAGGSLLNDRDLLALSDETRLVVRSSGAHAVGQGAGTGAGASATGTHFRDAASMLVHRSDLKSVRSAADLRRHAERLHLINEVHQALSESPSRDAVLELILDRVFATLRPEEAAVLLVDREGQLTESVSRPPGLGTDRVFFSRSLMREVTERRQAALVLDAPTDERFNAAASILDSGVRSVLAAPLLTPEGALGMLVLRRAWAWGSSATRTSGGWWRSPRPRRCTSATWV